MHCRAIITPSTKGWGNFRRKNFPRAQRSETNLPRKTSQVSKKRYFEEASHLRGSKIEIPLPQRGSRGSFGVVAKKCFDDHVLSPTSKFVHCVFAKNLGVLGLLLISTTPINAPTKCGGGGTYGAHPLTFSCFELFDWFCFRACRQFASHSRKVIENLQFAVQIEIFHKNTFLPYHHLHLAL